ncbi:MAG: helix-turn-helix domain-containing protein [Acidimicrobiales bacterium]|nr:helix-turn-helix domain-containing protein [Acidimicrobiales bacterium]
MIRQRGGTTRRRDDQQDETMSSAEEIGRQLRGAREERGLDLLAVHDRLSRPITQLEALEHGDLTRLPDQALALSTLRRYAAFLGLDGDALALRMIDAWSASPAASAGSRRIGAGTAPVTNVMAAVTTGPDHLRAFTQTGQVPKVGDASTAAAGGYGYGVSTGPPTGTFPVVPRQDIKQSKRAVAKARRRLRAPTSLKVITWVTAALVVVALVGFGASQLRAQWLARSHLLRIVQPGGTPVAAPAPNPGAGGHTHQAAAVQLTSTQGTTSNYTVTTPKFTVAIATTGSVWVQVTSSSSTNTLVSAIQPAGKTLTFPATGAMTVEVGASAVVVAVTVNGKSVFFDRPTATPFTYVFNPAH